MPSLKPSSQGRNDTKLTQPTKIPKTNSYFLVHNQIKEKKKHGRYSKKKNKQYKKRKTCGQILRPQMCFFFFFLKKPCG